MNTKHILCGLLAAVLCGCASPRSGGVASKADPQLTDRVYLYEVIRHLYRWYMDEADVDRGVHAKEFTIWVRDLHPKLDEGDNSRFGEIMLPALGIFVTVKKPDYAIEEYGIRVTSDTYKIVNVARHSVPPWKPADYVAVTTPYTEMRDYLFKTRSDVRFPDDQLMMRMRAAVRESLEEDVVEHPEDRPKGEQVIHVSPMSPVANELWVFWETGRLMIRFTSDMDIANPALWEHDELAADLYDVDEQVVVSLDEAPGSNAFLTRDQIGRALYNCVILGKRIVLQPLDEEPGANEEAHSPNE